MLHVACRYVHRNLRRVKILLGIARKTWLIKHHTRVRKAKYLRRVIQFTMILGLFMHTVAVDNANLNSQECFLQNALYV